VKLLEPPPCVLLKPKWWSQNTDDIAAMKAWVEERLRVRLVERVNRLYAELKQHGGVEFDPKTRLAAVVRFKLEDAIDVAEQGNMEPLRKAYPEIAAYINPRPRQRGERRHTKNLALKRAVEDVHFIRQLWMEEYGHWKRRRREANAGGIHCCRVCWQR
jgi:hypothetical protein